MGVSALDLRKPLGFEITPISRFFCNMACHSKSTIVTFLTFQTKIQLKILENMFFNAQKRVFEPQKPLDMFPESIWMRENDF